MTKEVLNVMAKHETICNYVHLPLQAGNDRILKRMNRTYTKSEFISLANQIRDSLPNVGLSTDIIVGFPGEGSEEFDDTLDVMEKVHFDSAYTFKYSSRPGTKAAEFEDIISEEEKQSRLERVIDIQKKHTLLQNKKRVGAVEIVLVEKESKRSANHWAGRTDSNKWVIFEKNNFKIGELVPIKIIDAKGITLRGETININKMEAA